MGEDERMKNRVKVSGNLWDRKVVTLYYVCHWAGESLSELYIIHLLWNAENACWEAQHVKYVKQTFKLSWTDNSLRARAGKDRTGNLKGHKFVYNKSVSSGNRLIGQYQSYSSKHRKLGESWWRQWLEVRTKKIEDTTIGLWREIMGREGWGGAYHKLKNCFTWKRNQSMDSKKRWNRGGRKNCSEDGVSEDKGLRSGEGRRGTGDCRNEGIRRDMKVRFRWRGA